MVQSVCRWGGKAHMAELAKLGWKVWLVVGIPKAAHPLLLYQTLFMGGAMFLPYIAQLNSTVVVIDVYACTSINAHLGAG